MIRLIKPIFATIFSVYAGSALALTQGPFFDLHYEDWYYGQPPMEGAALDSGMLGGPWTSGDEIKSFDELFMIRFDTKAIVHDIYTQIGEGSSGDRIIGSYDLYKNASVKNGVVSGTKLSIPATLTQGYEDTGSAYASMSPNLTLDPNTIYGIRIRGATVPTYFWTYVNFVVMPPVPEPENYAMLLAGLGVMGAVARRKSKHVPTAVAI